jgi:uncharacterized protein YbaR (Trm112 family)
LPLKLSGGKAQYCTSVPVLPTGPFIRQGMPDTIHLSDFNPDKTMPVDSKLLEILCCPVSKTPLNVLGREKLDKLNSSIKSGEALYVNGEKLTEPLQEGLITEDGKVIYPVQDDIPVLLEEKGIGTTQFQDF